MNKAVLSIAALLAALVAFVALNLVAQATLRSARLDLTQSRLYTVSQGSRNITRSLKEPVRLTLYYSEQAGNDAAVFKPYAARVKELLREFAAASKGKIELRIVNPEPFSDTEDQAVQAGIAGLPTGHGNDRLYFGLVGKNSTDKQEIIPFFDPQKEEFLEYDITRLVYLLSDAPRKTIGLMTWLPIDGQQSNPMMGRGSPPTQIYRQLSELFDVKSVPTTTGEIPAEIGTLMLVHPKKMVARTQYAIDQFVLRGGRLLLFVDPLCESDVPPGINPMQAMNIPKDSDLNTLLGAWGVEMLPGKVAADRDSAIRVSSGSQARPEPVDYVAWMTLGPARRDTSDPITGQVQSVNMASAGVLTQKEGASTQVTPLLTTSTNAMTIDATSISFVPDPKKLLAEFKSEGKSLTLAARITGPAKTAFPDGPPPPEPAANPNEPPPKPPTGAPLKQSTTPINVVVFTDCDMLQDRFWIQEERLGSITLGYRKFADNGELVVGALDNLSGSSDLISLRARGRSNRPFDTVQKIQKDAEQQYLAKESELQKKLRDTEQKIADLQRTRADASGKEALILSPEQQQAIDKFRTEMVATRHELRDVQHQLRKDIERLGSRVKALNIALMPVLVGLGAVGLAAFRSARRRAERHSVGATS